MLLVSRVRFERCVCLLYLCVFCVVFFVCVFCVNFACLSWWCCRHCQALGLEPSNGRALRCLAEVYRKAGLVDQAFAAAKVRVRVSVSVPVFFFLFPRLSSTISLCPPERLLLPWTSHMPFSPTMNLFLWRSNLHLLRSWRGEVLAALCPSSAGSHPISGPRQTRLSGSE